MTSIIIVQPHLEYGGAERQTVLLANELVRRGHSCHVVLHEARGGLLSELAEGVIVHDLALESHLRTFEVARRLRRTLSQIPPSFVIVKLWSSILACALVEKKNPQHTYNYCEDLDPLDHAEYIRFGKLKQRLIGNIFRSRPLLSANTNTVADSMRSHYGIDKEIAVISSVVEPELVQTKAVEAAPRDGFEKNALNVVSVGSLIPRKGYETAFQALSRVQYPVRWHVIGVGPLGSKLASNTQPTRNLEIVLHGGTANPYGLMKAADVMIHSASSEAFGIVLLESLSAGTPVIAANAIGPAEMSAVLGFDPNFLELYEKNNTESLSRVLDNQVATRTSWTVDAREYIAPYVLDSTVKKWLARAEATRQRA